MRRPAVVVEGDLVVREYPGDPQLTALLWVHGLGESGLCFESVVAHGALIERRCLVPDLPGYGRSPWPAEPPSLVDLADLLGSWLEGRGEEPVVVVGHSMGGVIATLMAERCAARVAAVIDIDGNLSAADCTYSGQAVAFTEQDFALEGFDRLRDCVWSRGRDDTAHRSYWASLRLADPAVFFRHSRELVDLSGGEQLAPRLAGIPVPALYLAGVPGGASSRSLDLLTEAGVDWQGIEPSGHWPFIDRPFSVADRIDRWLDDHHL